MRNLKKFLALVLAMMMVFSLMVTVNATTTFDDDEDISKDYATAAQVLQFIGVYEGSNNKMDPQGDFTRAFLATLGYKVGTGDVDDEQSALYVGLGKFDDVPESNWANPYINYAYIAEWVHGQSETKYNPSGKVTGYEVLALLLQIMGYGKNGEFIGPNWKIETARYADEAGLTEGLKNVTLSKVATREQVAQMVFNALKPTTDGKNDIVTYDARMTRYTTTGQNLGWKYFRLARMTTEDKWGRPLVRWYQDLNTSYAYESVNDTATVIAQDPVFDEPYVTPIDECDLYEDLELDDDALIESCWIDGNKQVQYSWDTTTAGDDEINALGVGDVIGAQGRQTEVYYMGTTPAGVKTYRLVEINTYLAEVTKVTAAEVDHAGHEGVRTIDLKVYVGWCDGTANDAASAATGHIGTDHDVFMPATKASEKYVVGDYVLVYINKPTVQGTNAADNDPAKHIPAGTSTFSNAAAGWGKVELVDYAPVIGSGMLTNWADAEYPEVATTTVGKNTFKDADKFYHNYRTMRNWAVYGDLYGNAIGLGISNANYAVIEAMQWIHSGLRGGYVEADLILSDGSRANGVRVATIDGYDVTNKSDTLPDGTIGGSVSDDWTNNGYYYGHIIRYSIDEASNAYNISMHALTNPDGEGNKVPDGNIYDSDQTNKASNTFTGTIIQGVADIFDDKDGNGILTSTDEIIGSGTDNTTYLLQNRDGTYTIIKGKDNVPTVRNADICILSNSNGYAVLVIVSGTVGATNTFTAYVGNITSAGSVRKGNNTYLVYNVYKLGETGITQVYVDASNTAVWSTYINASTYTGFYVFSADSDNILTGTTVPTTTYSTYEVLPSTSAVKVVKADPGTDGTLNYVNVAAMTVTDGRSLWTQTWTAGTIDNPTLSATYSSYDLSSDATYILVTKTSNAATARVQSIRKVDYTEIGAGDVLVLAYRSVGGRDIVDYVYIFRVATASAGGPVAETAEVDSTYKTMQLSINNTIVATSSVYAKKGSGTDYNALQAALSNAKAVSLSVIGTNGAGSYSINAATTDGSPALMSAYVYASSAILPTSAITLGASTNLPLTSSGLVVGNYIVIAIGGAGSAATSYAAFLVTA